MAHQSCQYLLLLAVAVTTYYATPSRWRWLPILAASTIFYASWRVDFLWVLLFVTLAQYFLALAMARRPDGWARRGYLLAALAAGLGVLAYFKYWPAVRHLLVPLVPVAAREASPELGLLVPIGISFYTLQTIGYLLDVYHRRRDPETHLGVFAAFVSFFPTVVSGPIERASHLLPQLRGEAPMPFRYDNISRGAKLIVWGFFLKLVVADRAALYVNAVFGNPDRHSGITFLAATVFYSFQVYCDFAGYSSVAIGSARLLGIDVMANFDRPYMASSVQDFWRRWHISLSTWLRDFVFLPWAYRLSRYLQRDRYGRLRVDKVVYILSALPTFAICGLWHGANLTFLVWGCLHGVYLAVENSSRTRRRHRVLGIARTYLLVLLSWVFFRADTVSDALMILRKIVTAPGRLFIPGGADVVAPIYALMGIGLLVSIEVKREFFPKSWSFFGHPNDYVRVFAYSLLLAVTVLLGAFDGGQFIYAQF